MYSHSGLEASSYTPLTTTSGPTNNSRNHDSLKDEDIEDRLYSALVEKRDEAPTWPCDPFLYIPSKLLQDQICQDDDNEEREQQQHHEVEEAQEEQDNNSGNNSEIDYGNRVVKCSKYSSDQDIDWDNDESNLQLISK